MRRILNSICSRGLIDAITGTGKLRLHRHARALAVMLVVALLVAFLRPNAKMSGNSGTMAATRNERSLASQLYRDLGATLATIGSWMRSHVRPHPAVVSKPYIPVAAYFNVPFAGEPTNLLVTDASKTVISISWTAPAGGADHYAIERSENIAGPFSSIGTATGTTYNDQLVTELHVYLYRVRAVTAAGASSTPSNMALGTAITFEFDELDNQEIRARHFNDIRTAINKVRNVAGRQNYNWARGSLTGLDVKADDVTEMRTALNEVLVDLSIPLTPYEDPTLAAGVTPIKATHLEQLQVRSTRGRSNSSGPLDADSSSARLDPTNETGGGGENPLSRNFNWNLPLINLPGRAGVHLGLTLSYNSLVWTKVGNSTISFNDDRGFPAPGFRLGFPTIQLPFFNPETGKNAFLLIGSDGSHTELRQVATDSTFYESADSSHLLLDVTLLTDPVDPRMVLRSSDGTQSTYKLIGQSYECTEIKDRNGNYITINYNTSGPAIGRISNIHDTLNRVITFNYANGLLSTITQDWKRQPPNEANTITHTWASFTYSDLPIHASFDNSFSVVGVLNNEAKVLTKVTLDDNSNTLADNSHVDFSYTPFGQVWKISSFAADHHLLNQRTYKLPKSPLWTDAPVQIECPRFTERRDWGQWANGDTDKVPAAAEEAVTTFSPSPASWTMRNGTQHSGVSIQVTAPDGTFEKIYFADSVANVAKRWLRRLPELVESFDVGGTIAQRRVLTSWEQDNETVSYELNPRIKETAIYDPALQHPKLTLIEYQQFTPSIGSDYRLPRDIFEYDKDATAVLRTTRMEYMDGEDETIKAPFISRRILGLVKEKKLYEGVVAASTIRSRVGFSYDQSGSVDATAINVQHDNTTYSGSFVTGRGNVTTITRHDVLVSNASTASKLKYNTAGAVICSKDALDHEVRIDYADSFSDNNNSRGTFAYPTTVIDPDNFYSTTKYNFDFGSTTYRQTPPANATAQASPAPSPVGPVQTFTYDDLGRLERTTSLVNNAYTRYQYPTSKIRVETFSTLVQNKGEARSFQILDGFGRAIASASDHPATSGTSARFDAQRTVYDIKGRVSRTSNPAETSAVGDDPAQWQLVEGDAGSSWYYTQYTYDWKGRPRITTNTDNTTKSVTYEGCGCAGGEIVTLTDEGLLVSGTTKTRQKKIYSDVLGRTIKTEVWNFDGSGPGGVGRSIYSTTVNTYDARDQVTLVRQFKGAAPANYETDLNCPTNTCQKTEFTYDGYGRLQTKHVPEQQQNPSVVSTWTYNADDTVNTLTDGRGAVTTYGYAGTKRRLVKTVSRVLGAANDTVIFGYDAAGNRLSMSHSVNGATQDSCSYEYDQLSHLISETKHINALAGSLTAGDYTMGYQYTLGGQLSSVTDPFNSTTNLNYDAVGRTQSVTGAYGGTNYTYANDIEYRAWGAVKRHDVKTIAYNNRMQPTQFRYFQYRYDYNYHPDGKLKHLIDLDDIVGSPSQVTFHYMSREYRYDQAGRLSAVDGNDNPIMSTGGIVPAPFVGYYGYDEFNNLVSRSGYYALNPSTTDSGTFVDNKRINPGWSYDADGRVLTSVDSSTSTTQTWTYDVAGRQIGISEVSSGATSTNTVSYDGDGKLLYESVTTPQFTKSDYLIQSTVLESALTKLDALGNKEITYVPANGVAFPMQMKDFNGNPVVGGVLRDVTGLQEDGKAVDPFGALIHNVQPPTSGSPPIMPFYGGTYGGVSYNQFTNANNFSSGCTLDGIRTGCQNLLGQVANGNAVVTLLSTTGTLADFFNAGFGGLIGAIRPGYSGSKDGRQYALFTSASLKAHASRNNNIGYFLPDSAGEWADVRWTATNFLFSDFLNLGPAFAQGPQNTFDFQRINTLMRETITKAPCSTFIRRILQAVSSKKNPLVERGDLEKLFFSVLNQKKGGFTRNPVPGGAGFGSVDPLTRIKPNGAGNAVIYLPQNWDPSLKNWLDTQGAIDELMHLAGKNIYSDYELAVAVNAIPEYAKQFTGRPESNPFDQRYQGDAKDKNSGGYSSFFHGVLRNICQVPKED